MITRNRTFYLLHKLNSKHLIPSWIVKLSSLMFSNRLETLNQSLKTLESLHPDENNTSYGKNKLKITKDLQIIIPAYNCENTIKECLESVLSQKTSYSFIVDVIDDGSTDKTGSIIQKINDSCPAKLNVIHETNKGLSGARNAALKEIKGRYVLFVDADDTLQPNAVDNLLKTAYHYNADIVEGGYNIFTRDKGIISTFHHKHKVNVNPFNSLYGFPWGKLYKAFLFRNVIFPEEYWFEDTLAMYRIWPYAKRVVTSCNINYNYRKNLKGITSRSHGSVKSLDTLWITKKLLSECDCKVLNKYLYDFTLRQIIMNTRRLSYLDNKVNKANFVMSKHLIDKYFHNSHTTKDDLVKLESALNNSNYIDFLNVAYQS